MRNSHVPSTAAARGIIPPARATGAGRTIVSQAIMIRKPMTLADEITRAQPVRSSSGRRCAAIWLTEKLARSMKQADSAMRDPQSPIVRGN